MPIDGSFQTVDFSCAGAGPSVQVGLVHIGDIELSSRLGLMPLAMSTTSLS
ncbi:hypothetical protein SAMN05444680_103341 [Variovorax sp. YR216]|nr:hypothetical protein SAMN05444680_103341 [Variovorax sp. YR216]